MKKNKAKFRTILIYAAGMPVLLIALMLISMPQLDAANPVQDSIPIFILDGKKISKETMETINTDEVESVSVYKSETAIEAYGEDGKNGVVEITMKKPNVYIVDGKEVTKEQAEQVDVKYIQTVEIHKNTKDKTSKIVIVTKK